MDKILIHSTTEQALNLLLQGDHHAVGLIGPYGAGKSYLAYWLACKFLDVAKPSINQVKEIWPEKNSIGIDAVRNIQSTLKLKAPGSQKIRRVIIIHDAQNLTVEAQNALLKILEEPPEDVRIIMTSVSQKALLPTVESRLHHVNVLPIQLRELYSAYSTHVDQATINKAYAISGGYAGLCLGILENADHTLIRSIEQAKTLFGEKPYDRLLQVDQLSRDKEKVRSLLFAIKRVQIAVAEKAALQHQTTTLLKIQASLRAVLNAEAKIDHNPNLKLLVTDVLLQL
ncbi:MAG: hypothetical protein U5K77_04375 [Candidatus Saccharibacteria bacterium]|nr:hypothetical protein [Candidatus Saccharibacteria bacterium]